MPCIMGTSQTDWGSVTDEIRQIVWLSLLHNKKILLHYLVGFVLMGYLILPKSSHSASVYLEPTVEIPQITSHKCKSIKFHAFFLKKKKSYQFIFIKTLHTCMHVCACVYNFSHSAFCLSLSELNGGDIMLISLVNIMTSCTVSLKINEI